MESEEIWKSYHEFDFIEGSSWGRVRTIDRYVSCGNRNRFIKGRTLKQQYRKNGYLQVTFSVNGKTVNRSVHRIIADCFLPNPDNLPQVNHINCNRTENNVDNLEWCTREYNRQYREKYGKAAGHPLYAINLETLKESRFRSQMEAGRQLGVSYQSIGNVIKGQQKYAGGYYFVEDTGDNVKIDRDKLRKIKSSMRFVGGVIAVNLITKEILHFKSQLEAGGVLGIDPSNISHVLAGRQKQAGGYYFTEDTGSDFEIDKNKIRAIADNMMFKGSVIRVDLKTLEVSRFESQSEATQRSKLTQGNVNHVLKGQAKQTKGYWFTYADSNAVEATRAKFGDVIAAKVKALMAQTITK